MNWVLIASALLVPLVLSRVVKAMSVQTVVFDRKTPAGIARTIVRAATIPVSEKTSEGEEDQSTRGAFMAGNAVQSGGPIGYPMEKIGVTYPGGLFGAKRGARKHQGLDLWIADTYDGIGTRILSATDGVVSYVVGIRGFEDRAKKTKSGASLVKSGTATRKKAPGKVYPATLQADGIDLYPFSQGGYSYGHMGMAVFVDSADGTKYRYMHLAGVPLGLKKGNLVKRGDVIGYLGCTDVLEDRPHLHFDISKAGQFIDPLPLITGKS